MTGDCSFMEHIFICYSRKDQDSALALKEALEQFDKEVWIDLTDLPASSIWRKEIEDAITQSIAFVYLVSKKSLESEYCKREFDLANQQNKRVFPILLPGIKDKDVPEIISARQWLYWQGIEKENSLRKLIIDIETDYEWVRFTTELETKATRWKFNSQNYSILLRGEELQKTEVQLANSGTKDPQPTNLQRQFVLTSRNDENRRRNRTITGLTFGFIAVSVFCVAAFVASFIAVGQRNQAVSKENARATAQAIAEEQAEHARLSQLAARSTTLIDAQPQTALLLALETYNQLQAEPQLAIPDVEQALYDALLNVPGIGFQSLSCNADSVLSTDSNWLAICNSNNITVVNLDHYESPPLTIETETDLIIKMGFLATKNILLSADSNGTIRLWHLGDERGFTELHPFETNEKLLTFQLSTDETRIITLTQNGVLEIWDISDTSNIYKLESNDLEYSAFKILDISKDGKWVLICNPTEQDMYGDEYDLSGKTILLRLNQRGEIDKKFDLSSYPSEKISAYAFDPQGRWLVTSSNTPSNDSILAWNLSDENPSQSPIILHGTFPNMNTSAKISMLNFSPDGKWLSLTIAILNNVYYPEGKVNDPNLWQVSSEGFSSQSTVLTGHAEEIIDTDFSDNGKWFATASLDGSVRLWDLDAEDPAHAYKILVGHQNAAIALAFSPDGHFLASGGGHQRYNGGDNAIYLWDLSAINDKISYKRYVGHEYSIHELYFTQDSQFLLSTDWAHYQRITPIGSVSPTISSPILPSIFSYSIARVKFSPDRHWLFILTSATDLFAWDFTKLDSDPEDAILVEQDVNTFGNPQLKSIAISPNGKWLATCQINGEIHLRDLSKTPSFTDMHVLNFSAFGCNVVNFSPDSQILIAGGDGIFLWNINASSLDQPFGKIPTNFRVQDTEISPDGQWISAVGGDPLYVNQENYVFVSKLSELETFDPIIFSGHTAAIDNVEFSHDSKWAATSSGIIYGEPGIDRQIGLWNIEQRKGQVINAHSNYITNIRFSPDDRWLASSSGDTQIILLDVNNFLDSPKQLILSGHVDSIYEIEFTKNGDRLISAGADQQILMWNMTVEDPSAIKPVLIRNLFEDRIYTIDIDPQSEWIAAGTAGFGFSSSSSTSKDIVRLIPISSDIIKEMICRIAGRNLYQSEWQEFFPAKAYHITCPQWIPGE